MSKVTEAADRLSLTKRALMALEEMQSKLETIERQKKEPIAVIGLGCRFPGNAGDPETYWRLLHDGTDATREIPSNRWNANDYYDPDPEEPGKMYTRHGGFLDDIDKFDPQFFAISPREAMSMDPQHRLLLEVSWEALENAGQAPDKLTGSDTGVFVGVMTDDNLKLRIKNGAPSSIDAYFITGNDFSFTTGRLSYLLGLHGPSIAVNTACSSSLVAVHLACQSLRLQECDLALAGGVNLILSPEVSITLSRFRALSADGRCKTFDAAADGFGRGEGCGVVVLKRFSDALAQGDNILALIRGSAVNHDGPSGGLTVPNGLAQQAMIRKALANAGIQPAQVNYVETHGTGTSLGDPIEVQALGEVLGAGRHEKDLLVIGSVKTNIGHLDSAAGVAGLIKVVLSLQHEEIPPHLHFKNINPHISLDKIPATIPTSPMPWPSGKKKRVAGISAFGLSGTNAHVVVEEAPVAQCVKPRIERPLHILNLSTKSEAALKELANSYVSHLSSTPSESLADICFTANTGRSHFDHRLTVVAESSAQVREGLMAFTTGNKSPRVSNAQIKGTERPEVAFLFTGQGSQYVGMGRQLYETQSTFRRVMDRCDKLLRPYLEQPLLMVLYQKSGSSSPLNDTAYTQPALFALEYALAELWRSWGIEPSAVMGHSVGEYVAACMAGVFSLEDGLKLIAERGRLIQGLPRTGAMAAVFADETLVAEKISPYLDSISVAAINGHYQTVISGKSDAMQMILEELQMEGLKTQLLTVSHAFHSPLMEPILDAFEQKAKEVAYSRPRIEIVSNVTGQLVKEAEVSEAAYWRRHIREPVRYLDSIQALNQQGFELFVEVGPQPILSAMGMQCLPDKGIWLPSLRQGQDDWQQILETLSILYGQGVPINWFGFDRDYPRRKVALPTYPFQRQRYWFEETDDGVRKKMAPSDEGAQTTTRHPLLGRRLRSALKDIQFEARLSGEWPQFLADHRVNGAVVVPGTAYIEMALAAGESVFGKGGYWLEEIIIREALTLFGDKERIVQFILTLEEKETASFQIVSLTDHDDWKLHVTGRIRTGHDNDMPGSDNAFLSVAQTRCQEEMDANTYYARLRAAGLAYGPCFQGISRLWKHDGEALGLIRLPDATATNASAYQLHPALLDACFQLSLAALPEAKETEVQESVYLPVGLKRLCRYKRSPVQLWCHVLVRTSVAESKESFEVDLRLFDETGQIVVEVQNLYLKRATRETLQRAIRSDVDVNDWLYEVSWEPKDLENGLEDGNPLQEIRNWLIFADQEGVADALCKRLVAHGAHCMQVVAGEEYSFAKGESLQLNPAAAADFQSLLQETVTEEQPFGGVIYLWGLDGKQGVETEQTQFCGGLLHLVQALAEGGGVASPRLWIVTRAAQPVGLEPTPLAVGQAPLWGLGGTITTEHPELECVRIDLDPWPEADESEILFKEICSRSSEAQVAFRQNQRYVARLVRSRLTETVSESPLAVPEDQAFRLDIGSPGILDALVLKPMVRRQPGPGEVEIHPRVVGLNFKDVLKTLGRYSGADSILGDECVGTVTAVGQGVQGFQVGDEVVAITPGSFRSFVITRSELVVPKPSRLTDAEAATIPTVFLTADYALHQLAKIAVGKRVLIHAATGGVGMAAVQIAQHAGAEIFATAGSPRKRALLRSLGVQHVMNSRSLDFADQVMALTDGHGVDIVLNSLAGDFIPKSLSVLTSGGCFVEIGKTGNWDDQKVAGLRPDVVYFDFYLGDILERQPELIHEMLSNLMTSVCDGRLKPLPHRVFPLERAVAAFRFMAQAKHIGKIVISQEAELAFQGDSLVRANATYLITGGLGGLGLKSAEWLVDQGAQHLVLLGRSGANATALEALRRMEDRGATVTTARTDVSQKDQLSAVLSRIDNDMPQLRGVIHAAGILDDGLLTQQTCQRFARVLLPKVVGSWNLHLLTQDRPLDFFVLFSSTASLLGPQGQGNYAAANAFLDALAHRRHALGLPALAINWGPWAQVGMVAAANNRIRHRLRERGMSLIRVAEGIEALGRVMKHNRAQIAVLSMDWARFRLFSPGAASLSLLKHVFQKIETSFDTDPRQSLPLETVLSVDSSKRQKLLKINLCDMAAKILQLSAANIDEQQPLDKLGLDSLMALELKNRIEANFRVIIDMAQLLQGPSISELCEVLLHKLDEAVYDYDHKSGPSRVNSRDSRIVSDSEDIEQILARLDRLSDDQMDRLLQKLAGKEEAKR